jgi:acetate kinase
MPASPSRNQSSPFRFEVDLLRAENMLILALNCGSSSLKAAVLDPNDGRAVFSALAESLNTPQARVRLETAEHGDPEVRVQELPNANHEVALACVIDALETHPALWDALAGVGHRVVHGGEQFVNSVRIDDAVIRGIADCTPLAPLHNPANLLGIEAARRALPDLVHVAVFDTAFHQTMAPVAYRYAIPETWYTRHRVRRYGFHGTSHRFVATRAAEVLERPLAELNVLTAHLGNGCSATAIAGGVSVDTTMGFTPLEGLVMGTRSGDVDPAVVFYLVNQGLSLETIEHELNRNSGLLGLSGRSHDMRALTRSFETEPASELAVSVFCHRLAKHLGGLATNFDHTDVLVFTGGIGEHSALVRGQVCRRLRSLGVELDETANSTNAPLIHSATSRVAVLVIPTNEELVIAQDTLALARPDV